MAVAERGIETLPDTLTIQDFEALRCASAQIDAFVEQVEVVAKSLDAIGLPNNAIAIRTLGCNMVRGAKAVIANRSIEIVDSYFEEQDR